jgi:hypothetical protein
VKRREFITLFGGDRLWRIDAAREKLETTLNVWSIRRSPTHKCGQFRQTASWQCLKDAPRPKPSWNNYWHCARCQRQTSSLVTPMGDEMFYRYQQSLIDEAATTVGGLLEQSPGHSGRPTSR